MIRAALIFGLAVVAVPVFAAEVDVANCTTAKAFEDAFNKGDASGLADLFAADGINVTPIGIKIGQAAIKQWVEETLKMSLRHVKNPVTTCIVDGNLRLSAGNWSDDGPQGAHVGGFWSAVETKQGSGWKININTYNLTPHPSAAKAQ